MKSNNFFLKQLFPSSEAYECFELERVLHVLLRCLGRLITSGGSGHVLTGGVWGARMCGVVQGHCPSLGLSPEGAQGPHRSCKICRHGGHSCLSTRVKFQCVPQPEQHRSGDVGLRHRFGHQLGYFQLYITSGTVSLHVWVLF